MSYIQAVSLCLQGEAQARRETDLRLKQEEAFDLFHQRHQAESSLSLSALGRLKSRRPGSRL